MFYRSFKPHLLELSPPRSTPNPTQAEAIQQTGAAYYRSKLTPFAQRLLAFLLRVLN